MTISVNGEITSKISVLDRGLSYGDGVFETCRLIDGKLSLFSLHADRLLSSCERLNIPFSRNQLLSYLDQHLNHSDQGYDPLCVCKIIVTRGAGGRGYQMDLDAQPTCIISVSSFPYELPLPAVKLYACHQRISSSSLLAGMKHLNRLENVLLKQECFNAGYSDGLVFDEQGRVIETTCANVFFLKGQKLMTPILTSSGVEGIARRAVIENLSRALSLEVEIIEIHKAQLPQYDSAFLCNSLVGVVPIISVADIATYVDNPIITRLQEEFERMCEVK